MLIKFSKKNYWNVFKHPLMGVTFPVWLNILWRNQFRISFFFIPKVFVITLVSLFNTPLHLLEYLTYSRRIKKQEVKAPIFIVGHPRSGTTHLHYLMSKDSTKRFCTLYQGLLPHSFLVGGNVLRNMIAKSIPATRPQDDVKISINSPKEEEFAIATMSGVSYLMTFYFPKFAQKRFDESVLFENEKLKLKWQKNFKFFIQKLSFSSGNKQLILKSPANTGRIKEILEIFPDAKFIYIQRDPLEVYQSTVRLYEKVIKETSFQNVDGDKMEGYIIESYRLMLDKFNSEKELIPKKCFTSLHYADLINRPINELRRIYKEIGLTGFDVSIDDFEMELKNTQDYQKSKYPTLSEEKVKELKTKWEGVAHFNA